MAGPIPISAKFRGTCKKCGKKHDVGDAILWQKNVGSWCQTSSCYNDWLALQRFSSAITP
jgi:hypothetical protein